MECLTATVGSLVPEIAKTMFKKFELHTSYVFHNKRRVENLKEKFDTLTQRRDKVEHDVDAAERNAEKVHNHVTEWLTTVVDDKLDAIANEVKDLEDKAEKKCFIGLCPNFKSRYQLSKKAEQYAKSADDLLQQGGFKNVSYPHVPQPIAFAYSKDFEAFDSRKQVFNEILKALKDPSIELIEVYGMAGVGKTTLFKEVARQVKEDKLLDAVVVAAVTHTPDIQKIQDQIADILGLKFQEKNMTGRASRLYERLKNEKKILVVLDDIWASLDLREVGIPFGDEHMGSTILFTSRDLHVLLNGRDAQKKIQNGILRQEEAWDLFKKMAGDKVESSDLRSTATEISKKCAGLPIAISTVARALRNKGSFAWRDALRQLNKPSSSNFRGVSAEAYSAIELSYNNLERKELQQTFLLCSLLGHGASIQDLLKYAMGLGLFQGVRTVEETRDRLLTVVSHLKASCLLLDSYNNHHFDMHDLISDVAISIASKDNRVLASRHEDVLNEYDWPDGETMKGLDKISLWSAVTITRKMILKHPKITSTQTSSKNKTNSDNEKQHHKPSYQFLLLTDI
ncbi:hypothetical protein DITRI_Ditri16bG0090900 [Diplodiscus trichospermus]